MEKLKEVRAFSFNLTQVVQKLTVVKFQIKRV